MGSIGKRTEAGIWTGWVPISDTSIFSFLPAPGPLPYNFMVSLPPILKGRAPKHIIAGPLPYNFMVSLPPILKGRAPKHIIAGPLPLQ
jgi:hypothetical protein